MMSDDGLKVPDGFEIERWPDGSPKLINIRRCPNSQSWINQCGMVWAGTGDVAISATGYYRIALKKKPARNLLDFRGAVEAASNGHRIYRDGYHQFGPGDSLCQSYVLGAIDRTDFYVEKTP